MIILAQSSSSDHTHCLLFTETENRTNTSHCRNKVQRCFNSKVIRAEAHALTCPVIFRGPCPASLVLTVNSAGLFIRHPDFSRPGPYAWTYRPDTHINTAALHQRHPSVSHLHRSETIDLTEIMSTHFPVFLSTILYTTNFEL